MNISRNGFQKPISPVLSYCVSRHIFYFITACTHWKQPLASFKVSLITLKHQFTCCFLLLQRHDIIIVVIYCTGRTASSLHSCVTIKYNGSICDLCDLSNMIKKVTIVISGELFTLKQDKMWCVRNYCVQKSNH